MAVFQWYVAQALAGLEATAIYYLTRAGITAFSPMLSMEPGSGRRPAPQGSRLFPGYIFVELESADEAGLVNRTRGIHKVLPVHASKPLALPPGFVEGLRSKLAGGDFGPKEQEALLRKFIPGDEVSILLGPFAEHQGKFLRYHKGSGQILAYLLGREVMLKVPLHQLAPASGMSTRRGARRVGELAVAA